MNYKITAQRYHDFSMGHRVVGHEGKCALLHGHNYRITFFCEAPALDGIGRVVDFSVIKEKLCNWIEKEWDHKFMAWTEDPLMAQITSSVGDAADSIVWVDFNPTAENIGKAILEKIAPGQLNGTGVLLTKVIVEETRKCGATVLLAPS